jgi:hypothetical protein
MAGPLSAGPVLPSWALQCPKDFQVADAGIPCVTLTNTIKVSDDARKWPFIFQMLAELPAELTRGKEDIYVGWWYKNKVFRPGVIPPSDVAAYAAAFARPGRMDAAFDYCRNIVLAVQFNAIHFKEKLPIRLLAVGGDHSIRRWADR